MQYADDADVILRSAGELARMMTVVVVESMRGVWFDRVGEDSEAMFVKLVGWDDAG